MVAVADAGQAIESWLERNVITRIPGEGKRAVVAVMAGRILKNAQDSVSALSQNPIVKASGLVKDGCIDEEVLVEIRTKLNGGKLEFNIPLIGTLGIDGDAIDELYSELKSI